MLSVVALVLAGWITSYGQATEPEVPGDHFSLEGALELFKRSESPEEFERMLNSADSKVNNLDLNGDGYIDYIRVIDRYEGNVHAFILQAVISDREFQDVAVIELEKLADGKAVLQIIGDEDIYGIETIIEPTREVRTYAGTTTSRTVVNVWTWPSVRYVYSPYYDGWMSPWAWHVHPRWWRPWRPIAYVHYHSYWRPYRPYYSVWHTHRVAYAHRIYHPHRTTSVYVYNRHRDQISRYRSTRHDGDRYRNSRNDDGRSYNRDDRSSTGDQNQRDAGDRNRRPSASGEDRTPSRDRSLPGNQRNYSLPQRNEDNRRIVTAPLDGEIRKEATNPSFSRSRSYESPDVQRSTNSGRSRSGDVRSNPAPVRRYEAPERRPVTAPSNREIRREASPNINRSRSYETPSVQRSPARERNTPSDIQRSSGGTRRYEAPSRPSTVERSRPSGGANLQKGSSAPGRTRTIETKRGSQ